MKPADEREEVILREALKRARGPEREGFLDGACLGNQALRDRLEQLLKAEETRGSCPQPPTGPPGTVTVVLPPEEGPGTVIGRYRILEKVGEGGFGAVYVAEQREPVKRRVALKIIKLGMDTKQVVARFEAERQALALMDHPNIAKVLDAGATETGRPYFVMELVKGIPITTYCDQEKLATRERLDLFVQVCHAIQHAHQKGIIHRDIKPSNILVTLHDGVPVPKVIDFGIAKATQQELTEKTVYTQLQQFIGTPAYMSPEQAEMSGLDIDTRSDIYSLGVLLYELLTGKTPFDAQELVSQGLEVMRRTIREKEPVRPSTKLATLPGEELTTTAKRRSAEVPKLISLVRGDLDWIAMKCLEKDRTRRYESVSGLAADLRRHLQHEPVVARPPSAGYRARKFVRRNRVVVTAAGIVVAVLVVGVVVSAWEAVRATRAEVRAEKARGESEQARGTAVTQRQRAEHEALVARQRAYAADMNLALHALAQNNLGRAEELLNRHRPKAGEQDLRGWEWRYLWQQCRSDASFTFCRCSNAIWSLAASADGKWLAAGEERKGGFSVFNRATRQPVTGLTAGDGLVRVAFSPGDGLLAFSVVTGSASPSPQYSVRLWDGASERIAAEFPIGGECMGMGFVENGQTLMTYTGNPDNRVALWRVPAGTLLASYPVSPFDRRSGTPGTPFALASDGTVAAVAPDNTVYLLDAETGKVRWARRAAEESIKALAFSPNRSLLASGAGFVESAIRLWDVATGKEMTRLRGHRAWVSALVFWPDGKTLASASGDQTIRLWDLSDIANVPPPRVLRGHKLEVWRLALLPDGKTLVSGSKDGSVYFWDTTKIRHEQSSFVLPATVSTWRFAPDSRSVVTVDAQGQVVRWKGTEFREREVLMDLGTVLLPQASVRFSVLLSADGQWVAAGSSNGVVQVWDLPRRQPRWRWTVSTGFTGPLEFSAQGKRLVIFDSHDGAIREWDLKTGQETGAWTGAVNMPVVALSQDDRWSFAVGSDGRSFLKETTTGREVNQQLEISQVDVATFSPDGRLLAAASSIGYAKLWEAATLRELAEYRGFLMGVHSVAFSPDGTRLAVGGDGSEAVKLWNVESRQELLTLEGQGSLFSSLAFSPDGNLVGSLNSHGQLHLWRAPSLAEINTPEVRAGQEWRDVGPQDARASANPLY